MTTTLLSKVGPSPVADEGGCQLSLRLVRRPDGIDVSVDHSGVQIATGSLRCSGQHRAARIEIEVVPEHRAHGVATAVLSGLIEEARNIGIASLTWEAPADDEAARRLAAGAGAVSARRVRDGVAHGVLFLT